MQSTNLLPAKRILAVLAILMLLAAIIPPVLQAAPPQQSGSGGSIVYYVQYGDTLFSIARRFGTTVPAIMSLNGLAGYNVYVGQRLIVPVGYPFYGFQPYSSIYAPQPLPTRPLLVNPTFTCKYTVQARDTVFSIAYRYQVTVPSLMQANNLYSPYIYVNQPLNVPCVSPTPTPFPVYTVQAGDNLFRIAIRYSTTIYAIALVNGLPNPNWILAGQNLVIPYQGSYVWPTSIPTLAPTLTPTATSTGATATATLTTTTGTNTAVVIMQNILFLPQQLTVTRGTTVIWKNTDSVNHTVTSGTPGAPDGKFRSPQLAPNQTFSWTFNDAGTYPYFDEIFGAQMTGTIIVQ
jgi:LysM repeat protein